MKRLVTAISVLLIGMSALTVTRSVEAAVDNTPDCDTVAIIRCGTFTERALNDKAKQNDVPTVFSAFGISQNELNGFVDGVVWKDGRVTVGNDRVVARNAMTAGRWDNPTPDMTRIPNTDRAFKMSTSHFVDDGQTAFIKMVDGEFRFAVLKPCGNPVTANPVPQPTFKCENLAKTKISRDTFRFTATASANNGAKIVKYRFEFGDGAKETTTSRTVTHTYAKPGNYSIRVTAIVEVNGKQVEATSAGCTTQVVVEKPPTQPVPEFACNFMNLQMVDKANRIVRTDTQSTAKNGAVFSHYLFNFGDGTPVVKSTQGTVDHTFAKDGTYTVRAHVVVTVNGQSITVTSDMCVKQVTFSSAVTPVVPPPATPPTEQPTESVPEELIDTGPGAVVGITLSTITAGALAYRYVWLRRYI